MTLNDDTEALVLAYVYGELSASAARAFEKRMENDQELRAEVEGLMATRKLLKEDAAWGLRSGTDVPPVHLVDAILKAEALARPPEIRRAGIVGERPTFTARLSRWLLGGGLVVGTAAAIFIVVNQDLSNPISTESAKPMRAQKAADPAQVEAERVAEADDVPRAMERESREARDMGAHKPSSDAVRPYRLEQKEAAPPMQAATSKAKNKEAQDVAASLKPGAVAPSPEPRPSEDAPFMSPASLAPHASEPPPLTLLGSSADSDGGAGRFGADKTADAHQLGAKRAEETNALRRDELKARRRMALEQVSEMKKASADRRLKRTEEKDARVPSSQLATPQAELALATAERELALGNALVALDEFKNAQRLDTRRLLGSDPIYGQIRALVLLKRPIDALALADQLLTRDLNEPGVADGIAYAADVAEKNGDIERAHRYWSTLLNAPGSADAQRARRNVDRLSPATAPKRAVRPADATGPSAETSEAAKH